MKIKRHLTLKLILFAILFITLLFFSNDFGLVDMEKSAIITAIAIDLEGNDYKVTAQIAMPEATDTNTENQKAQLIGKGDTVGAALKNIGDESGWYPYMSFCNLIILGNSTLSQNVIKIIDYFTNTLRLQDSTVVALSENSAAELLEASSPLDNISSFAIQKVLFKRLGFDKDTATNDIKSFSIGYYSQAGSSYMPIIKLNEVNVEKPKDDTSGSGMQGNAGDTGAGSNSGSPGDGQNNGGIDGKGKYVFNANTTALFKDGFKVGELNHQQTLIFNALTTKVDYTTITAKDPLEQAQGENSGSTLFTIISAKPKIKLKAGVNNLDLYVSLDVYGKISDQNYSSSATSLDKNLPLPSGIKKALIEKISTTINEIIEISKSSGCDVLEVGNLLYRFNYDNYPRYKDNFLEKLTPHVSVNLTGQK